jgi:hypothetical protein
LPAAKKISGVCVQTVLISLKGTAQQIRFEKMLGYGLDEQGYEAIRTMDFRARQAKERRPAHRRDRPIEVTFRLY